MNVRLLESALYVADLERAQKFFERLLGTTAWFNDERMSAMPVGNAVLLLFLEGASVNGVETPGGFITGHDGTGPVHLAFAVDADDLDAWKARLGEMDVPIESVRQTERGGTSVYFRDPDGHCLEIATPGIWPTY